MSNSLKSDSQNVVDPTVGDPRLEEISEFTGLPAEEVLAHVAADAEAHGTSVEAELQDDVETVEMIEALGDI